MEKHFVNEFLPKRIKEALAVVNIKISVSNVNAEASVETGALGIK